MVLYSCYILQQRSVYVTIVIKYTNNCYILHPGPAPNCTCPNIGCIQLLHCATEVNYCNFPNIGHIQLLYSATEVNSFNYFKIICHISQLTPNSRVTSPTGTPSPSAAITPPPPPPPNKTFHPHWPTSWPFYTCEPVYDKRGLLN